MVSGEAARVFTEAVFGQRKAAARRIDALHAHVAHLFGIKVGVSDLRQTIDAQSTFKISHHFFVAIFAHDVVEERIFFIFGDFRKIEFDFVPISTVKAQLGPIVTYDDVRQIEGIQQRMHACAGQPFEGNRFDFTFSNVFGAQGICPFSVGSERCWRFFFFGLLGGFLGALHQAKKANGECSSKDGNLRKVFFHVAVGLMV